MAVNDKQRKIFILACICLIGLLWVSIIINEVLSLSEINENEIDETKSLNTNPKPTWHKVANFTGSGEYPQNTSLFQINGYKIKIILNARSNAPDANIYLSLCPSEALNPYHHSIITFGTSLISGTDIAFGFNGNIEADVEPGSYYIQVDPYNREVDWQIEILEYY